MKRIFLTICLIGITIGFASCRKEGPMEQTVEHNNIIVNTNKAWETSELPAYIGDISYFPEELQSIIRKRFPENASIERAYVIFVGKSELATNYELLRDAAADGKYIVIPGDADYTLLGGGADPMISPSESEDLVPMFCCYTGWGEGQLYMMYNESAPLQLEEGTPSLTDEEWYELNEKGKAEEEETEDDFFSLSDYDNHEHHNENYYQSRIDPFVKWVDDSFMERHFFNTSTPSYNDLKVNIEQSGMRLTYNYPFSLNKFIDKATGSKADYLCKSSSITVEFRIYPVYMHSGNGEKAGDYYGVVSTVTPHNESMWGPYCSSHGWTRLRIYGYWFNQMDVETSLTHLDGSPINGLNYYDRPIPENKNDSKTYSNGKSITISGSISGGTSAGKAYVVGQFGMSGTWTSSTNYSLETINYSLDSSTPNVKYHYWTENVALKDDWGNWSKIHQNFPAPVRTEFSGHSMWVWHVPGDVAQDNSTKNFKLNTKIKMVYSSWRHWRGTATFDSNKKDYDVIVPERSWEIGHPDRTPWGYIKLRNASDKEMAHVKFYDATKENGEPIETFTNSYGKGETVQIALIEGTYNITWDIVDGNTGEKVSSWIYRNVKVSKGKDENSATTFISSVDGERL